MSVRPFKTQIGETVLHWFGCVVYAMGRGSSARAALKTPTSWENLSLGKPVSDIGDARRIAIQYAIDNDIVYVRNSGGKMQPSTDELNEAMRRVRLGGPMVPIDCADEVHTDD